MSINDEFPVVPHDNDRPKDQPSSSTADNPSAETSSAGADSPRYGSSAVGRYGAFRDPSDPNTDVPLPTDPGYQAQHGYPQGGYGGTDYQRPYPDYSQNQYGGAYGGGAYPTGPYGFTGYGYSYGDGSPYPIGPIGQTRNPVTTAVLAIVTFGIYPIYWWYKNFEDLNNYRSGRGLSATVAVLLAIFFSLPLPFILCSQVEEAQRESGLKPNVSILTGFWYLAGTLAFSFAYAVGILANNEFALTTSMIFAIFASIACQFYFWYRAQIAVNHLWSVGEQTYY